MTVPTFLVVSIALLIAVSTGLVLWQPGSQGLGTFYHLLMLAGGAFVVFALSLFGLFNLQLPSFLINAAGAASMKGGYLGVFLMGATLVVTSFTCTQKRQQSAVVPQTGRGRCGAVMR